MSVLRNARRESFAQALAAGATAIEAHEKAGYKPDRGAACRLAAEPEVEARVAELQDRAAKKAMVTIDSIAAELEAARALAISKDQPSAAVQASMGKAKLYGLVVEKRQHSGPNGGPIQTIDLTGATESQLAALEALFGPLAGGSGDDDGGDPSGEGEESR